MIYKIRINLKALSDDFKGFEGAQPQLGNRHDIKNLDETLQLLIGKHELAGVERWGVIGRDDNTAIPEIGHDFGSQEKDKQFSNFLMKLKEFYEVND